MERKSFKRLAVTLGIFAGVWILVRYLLPIGMPFLLGTLIAMAAEPGVRFITNKTGLSRAVASFLVVFLGYLMIFVILWMLGAVLYRELALVASGLPGLVQGLSESVDRVRSWAIAIASRAPEGMRSPLAGYVEEVFAGGSLLLEKTASGILGAAGNLMGGLPGGAMLLGTAVISSFMISAQFPVLRRKLKRQISKARLKTWLLALERVKTAVLGWLRAQFKLSGVTFCIIAAGFLILRVRNPVFWAGIVSVVDAIPLLGTGTVLIPWALFSLLQGEGIRAMGLMGLYVTAMLVRSGLEPKLLGRHLGINPLVTLVALYAGYQIWGVGGMVLAPILTVTAKQLTDLRD